MSIYLIFTDYSLLPILAIRVSGGVIDSICDRDKPYEIIGFFIDDHTT